MQSASQLRSHYADVRARLGKDAPAPVPIVVKPRPPIIYPPKLRRYPMPIGPVMPDKPQRIQARSIVRAVSLVTGVTMDEIAGTSKLARICRARFLACYLIKKHTDHSLNMIGRALGRDFDHTTVLNAIRQGEYMVGLHDGRAKGQIKAVMAVIRDDQEAFIPSPDLSTVTFPKWLPWSQQAAYVAMSVDRGAEPAYSYFYHRYGGGGERKARKRRAG